MSNVERVTTATFEDKVLDSKIPVLVDFYTSWCPSCKTLEPTLERLAAAFAGQVRIAAVDVEQERELGQAFEIRSVPTLGFFMNGQLVFLQAGVPTASALETVLRQVA